MTPTDGGATPEPRATAVPDGNGRHDGSELVAIVAAMKEEIEPLRRRAGAGAGASEGPLSWTRGRLGAVDVVLAVTGEGRRNAERGLRAIIARHRPTRVLAIGVAGALSEGLRVGDLLLAVEVRDGDDAVAPPDPAWLARARALGDWPAARLVTVDEILFTPAAKSRWRDPACPRRPAAADMESASYARAASEHRIPYLAARAVSDRADESLPAFLSRCRDRNGGIDRRRVLRRAPRHPGSWGTLLRLRSRLRRCATRLADLTEVLVAALA